MNALPFILWRNGELVMGVPANCRTAGTNVALPELTATFRVATENNGSWHDDDQVLVLKRIIAWGRPINMLLIDALVNSIIAGKSVNDVATEFTPSRLDVLSEMVREGEPLCIMFLTNKGLLTISEEVNNVWQLHSADEDYFINTTEAVYSVMKNAKGRDSATIDLMLMLEDIGVLGANIPSIDYIHYGKADWFVEAVSQ